MYTTTMSPWQSSAFIPQQSFASQSFMPLQFSPQIQGYSMPYQTGAVNISPWAYQLPYANAMISQTGTIPAWQPPSPMISGQYFRPVSGMMTGINTVSGLAQPRVELAETNHDGIVTADLPNVDPNNIYITVTDDSLSISALSMMGGSTSSLHRTVALPTNIRAEHLDVSYTNGILECRLPKSDLVARRRVKV